MGYVHAFEAELGDQLTDTREACAHIARQGTQLWQGMPCLSLYRIFAMHATAEGLSRSGLPDSLHCRLPGLLLQVPDLRLAVPTDRSAPIEKISFIPSTARRFQALACFGCTLCGTAVSCIVLSRSAPPKRPSP